MFKDIHTVFIGLNKFCLWTSGNNKARLFRANWCDRKNTICYICILYTNKIESFAFLKNKSGESFDQKLLVFTKKVGVGIRFDLIIVDELFNDVHRN